MDKIVHIVCLQVPYPPDYGGVTDLFWKLKYLKEIGVSIHLHCFEYGREQQDELLKYCASVQYYKRITGIAAARWNVPYIVSSRMSKRLKGNLAKDNHPILLEGIHCTWLLHTGFLKNRKVVLRLHNIEWDYYGQLATVETRLLKKWYYRMESRLLKKYEPAVVAKATGCLAVSEKDAAYWHLQQLHQVHYLPVFLPWNEVIAKQGKGSYCLYHGNLSVAENEQTAWWLIERVFVKMPEVQFIVAGKNPSERLVRAAGKHKHLTVVPNPSAGEMEQLIADAHIHLLPSFTNSGIKLKLLNALFCGRFCIVNREMVHGTGLEDICIVANSADDFIQAVKAFMEKEFSAMQIREREQLLLQRFNNKANARMLAHALFFEQVGEDTRL